MAVIVVLDFLGPVGLLTTAFPIDAGAVVQPPPMFGDADRLRPDMRGKTAGRVPISDLLRRGYAVFVSCYGSWVPDCPTRWRQDKLRPFLGVETGALSLWAWAYLRLIDAAVNLMAINRIAIAGHSRLGKSALWAAAHDTRISAVFANQSGCFGAAPHGHPVGERADQLIERFPHWVVAKAAPEFDQHVLLALVAPRRLYLGAARDDVWADPLGSYAALRAASAAWNEGPNWPSLNEIATGRARCHSQRVGYHLRDGGHDLLPEDWTAFLDFLRSATP